MAEYIEKQAALDIVNGWRDQLIPTYGKNDEYVKCLETVAEHLESLHAADVRAVRRGQWRKIGNNSDGTSDYECSACLGIMMRVPDDDEHPLVSFCSMCGADMRGERKGGEE